MLAGKVVCFFKICSLYT